MAVPAAGNNQAAPAQIDPADQALLDKQKAADQASFARSMALMELQRQQQEQTQMLGTLSAMLKNDGDNKMNIVRNLKTS